MKGLTTKQSIIMVVILMPLLIAGAAMINGWRLYFNLTDSLPHTVYIGKPFPSSMGKSGDYIVFNHPVYPDQLLIKQIKGLPGDQLLLQKSQLRIGQDTLTLLTHNSKGKELKPLQLKFVPVDTVFVAGTHPRSFDSRYASFGLVHNSQIRSQVWPLF